jgi:putative transcriptional regulator
MQSKKSLKKSKRSKKVMKEATFNTNLSDEEIKKNFASVDFFSGIMSGLEEALAYEKGTARAQTLARKRSLPEVNVAAERKALGMTQKSYAALLGVSCRTIEAWESGKSNPTPTAKILISLISQDHSLVQKLQNS